MSIEGRDLRLSCNLLMADCNTTSMESTNLTCIAGTPFSYLVTQYCSLFCHRKFTKELWILDESQTSLRESTGAASEFASKCAWHQMDD